MPYVNDYVNGSALTVGIDQPVAPAVGYPASLAQMSQHATLLRRRMLTSWAFAQRQVEVVARRPRG
jgi:hypothetical protein